MGGLVGSGGDCFIISAYDELLGELFVSNLEVTVDIYL